MPPVPTQTDAASTLVLALPQGNVSMSRKDGCQRVNLLTIPREIRDMIIVPFLRSGDLVVLHICQKITQEALQRIKHESTFRVNFGIRGRDNTILDKTSIPLDLQNVQIRIGMTPWSWDDHTFQSSSIRHLSYRDGADMNRCEITFNYFLYSSWHILEHLDWRCKRKDYYYRPCDPQLLPMLSYALSGFGHFNFLVIKVNGFLGGEFFLEEFWNPEEYRNLFTRGLLRIDESDHLVFKARLEPALGPAQIINDGGDCHIDFYPRKFSASGQKKSPPEPNLSANRCRLWNDMGFTIETGNSPPTRQTYVRKQGVENPLNWEDEWSEEHS